MKWWKRPTDLYRRPAVRKLRRTHGAYAELFYNVLLDQLAEAEDDDFMIRTNDRIWVEDITYELHLPNEEKTLEYLFSMATLGLIDSQLWEEGYISSNVVRESAEAMMQKRKYEREKKRKQRENSKVLPEVENMSRESRDIVVTSRHKDDEKVTRDMANVPRDISVVPRDNGDVPRESSQVPYLEEIRLDKKRKEEENISKTLKQTRRENEQDAAERGECVSEIVPAKKKSKPEYSNEFEAWWKNYILICRNGKSQYGSKANAWNEWKKDAAFLSSEEFERQDEIFRAVQAKRLQTAKDGKLYLPHGERYLKQRRWEGAVDELNLSNELSIDLADETSLRASRWQMLDDYEQEPTLSDRELRRLENERRIAATRERDGF